MKQEIVKVDWLQFCGDARAVEKHLVTHPGVLYAAVNPVSGVAVVGYDESLASAEDIRRIVTECGYHCHIFGHGRTSEGKGHGTR